MFPPLLKICSHLYMNTFLAATAAQEALLSLCVFVRVFIRTQVVFGNFWKLLATVGNFWQLLATVGNFWQLLAMFGNFWHLLATFGNFW